MTARRATSRSSDEAAMALALAGVRRLDRGLRLAARQVERETGLSAAQLYVLEQLREAPAMSLTELARRTFTDRSSVSAVVDRLVAARLAHRAADRSDRRRAELRITPRGRRMLARAPAAPTVLLLRALATLPRARRQALGRALAELNEALGFDAAGLLFEPGAGDVRRGASGGQRRRARETRSQR